MNNIRSHSRHNKKNSKLFMNEHFIRSSKPDFLQRDATRAQPRSEALKALLTQLPNQLTMVGPNQQNITTSPATTTSQLARKAIDARHLHYRIQRKVGHLQRPQQTVIHHNQLTQPLLHSSVVLLRCQSMHKRLYQLVHGLEHVSTHLKWEVEF